MVLDDEASSKSFPRWFPCSTLESQHCANSVTKISHQNCAVSNFGNVWISMGHVPTPFGRLRLSSQQICGTSSVKMAFFLIVIQTMVKSWLRAQRLPCVSSSYKRKWCHKNYEATQQLPTLSITGITIIKNEWGEKQAFFSIVFSRNKSKSWLSKEVVPPWC